MAYLSLYRRYRPNSFSNLIGQDHIVKTLINQIESGKIGHAYLFTGTRGTGKTSAAKIFAKAINCEHPLNGSPCGKCSSCLSLSEPSQIDIIEIDAASNNGVNEIRDLRDNVQYPPVSCKYKVYIIDEVHMLTGAAFNALLKTLEEPPKHAVFILATTEVHKLPATILSRCMRFDFRLIPTEQIASLIESIYLEQGKEFEKEAVFAISAAGEGSIRDALSIADTAMSYGKGKLTYNDVTEILGSSNFSLIFDFVESMIKSETGKMLEIISTLSSLGKSMGVLIKDITNFIRNLIVVMSSENANKILLLPEDRFNELKELSKITSEQRLIRMLEIFTESENALKYTNHPRVIFETASIKASKPENDYDIDALLSRIKSLEEKLKNGNYEIKPLEKSSVTEEIKVKEKQSISSVQGGDISGKLLFSLRENGYEMLWNTIQTAKISSDNNTLVITAKNEVDANLIDKDENRQAIQNSLSDFLPFELKVVFSGDANNGKIENETDRLKRIFGDDIVIIDD